MAKKGSWTTLGEAKLESSGLSIEIAEQLGMWEVASAKTLDDSFDARAALVMPYMDFDKKPFAAHPKWPNFYRVRYLKDEAASKSFLDVAGEKAKRYVQPPRSGVCAYFPALFDWRKIAKDPSHQIIITEGELKAAAACVMEFPTIGLGGVWNFQSKKDGIIFLPELNMFDWVTREVFICFDSDYVDKPNICAAINALAEELQERGASPRVVTLPDINEDEDAKTGLDDYFLECGAEEFSVLLREAVPLGLHRALHRMNKEVVYVENPGMVIAEDTGQKISVDNFKSHSRWSTESSIEATVTGTGGILREKVSAAPTWVRWPMRRSVKSLTYAPGEPKITPDNQYNQWSGWGVTPKKGDVTPWLELTQFIFGDMEKGILEYFYDWCAYPIQNPGTKMFTAVVVHGIVQGTGKTLIGYTLGEVYGKDNWKEITDEDLEETFWAENKQFILGDEVSGKDNRAFANKLKRLITGQDININIKFVPQFSLPNRMNFYFTSQHGDSFFLEDRDRRYLVIEVTEDPLSAEFYNAYKKWLWEGEGAAYLMQWLLDRKISKKFNPFDHAPKTAAKDRMISAGKGDVGMWINDLLAYPDQTLRIGQLKYSRDLFTSKELLDMYASAFPNHKVSTNGMARALATAGAVQVDGGHPLRGPDGKMARYFAVRNIARWKKEKERRLMESNVAQGMVKS